MHLRFIFGGKIEDRCRLGKMSLVFSRIENEGEDDEKMGFGLFDDHRPLILDSYFPFTGLIEEHGGFICVNFGV